MLKWREDVVFLSARPYGEKGQIVSVLSKNSGKYNGWFYGGNSFAKKNLIQQGNFLHATWKSRLSEQLGSFNFELIRSNSSYFINEPIKLACLNSLCAILDKILPEREPNSNIYMASITFINLLSDVDETNLEWLKAYVKWELGLISFLGFSFELKKCAVTGLDKNLAYVSPKSGKTVAYKVGEKYEKKLLLLPKFLGGNFWDINNTNFSEIEEGLKLSSFFLKKFFFEDKNNFPKPRERLNDIVNKLVGKVRNGSQ